MCRTSRNTCGTTKDEEREAAAATTTTTTVHFPEGNGANKMGKVSVFFNSIRILFASAALVQFDGRRIKMPVSRRRAVCLQYIRRQNGKIASTAYRQPQSPSIRADGGNFFTLSYPSSRWVSTRVRFALFFLLYRLPVPLGSRSIA